MEDKETFVDVEIFVDNGMASFADGEEPFVACVEIFRIFFLLLTFVGATTLFGNIPIVDGTRKSLALKREISVVLLMEPFVLLVFVDFDCFLTFCFFLVADSLSFELLVVKFTSVLCSRNCFKLTDFFALLIAKFFFLGLTDSSLLSFPKFEKYIEINRNMIDMI